MADKELTDSAWKAFAKGKAFKDAGLLKALEALDKAEKGGPDAQIEALDDVDRQAGLLRKDNKADKELGAYLDKLGAAAVKARKAAEAALVKAASASSEDEEESPAQLTTMLVPLLRQVPKGDVVMQVLIATTGKEMAVLLSRKALSPARGKLLKEYLGASGALKFIRGECLFEKNAHTFVVVAEVAGLAKKLQAALLAQTGLRVKVRVRGEDPDDVDEELEEAVGTDSGSEGVVPAAAASAEGGEREPSIEQALDAWRSARGAAVTTLKGLAARAAAMRDPESARAVMEVSAVVKQLSGEPRTASEVADLIRYVNEDDVVFDVCEIDTDIRTPMIGALANLQRAVVGGR